MFVIAEQTICLADPEDNGMRGSLVPRHTDSGTALEFHD
jgi:hypothetical protein